jgi:hypothetical protein
VRLVRKHPENHSSSVEPGMRTAQAIDDLNQLRLQISRARQQGRSRSSSQLASAAWPTRLRCASRPQPESISPYVRSIRSCPSERW